LRYIHVNIDEMIICIVSTLSVLGVSVFSVECWGLLTAAARVHLFILS